MNTRVLVPEQPRPGELRRHSLSVLALALAVVLAGWALKSNVERRTATFTSPDGALSLAYPGAWMKHTSADQAVLLVSDPRSDSAFQTLVRVESRPAPEGRTLREAATALSISRSRGLREYRELATESTVLAGEKAIRTTYAHVADPATATGPATLPVVVQASETMLLHDGRLWTFATAADANQVSAAQPSFQRVLQSVRLK